MIDLEPGEIIVDNFAGGGGASVGIEMALGRSPDESLNHDPEAIAMHAANHPHTHHHCQDIWSVSPRKVAAGRRIGLAWFSPDCKDHSKAKGGKPVEKRIRDLAWVVCWWAHAVKPRIILLENVEEFAEWGPLDENNKRIPERKGETFQRWLKRLRELGYHVEYRELKACDYGAPTSRNRLYVVARRDGKEIVWPQPTHGPAKDLKPYRTAAECIDWSIPALSIFATKAEARAWAKLHRRGIPQRPLADNTLRRTARGLFRYVLHCADPFVVRIGQTKHGDSGKTRPVGDPLSTICTKNEHLLLTPLIAPLTHQGETRRSHPANESLPVVTGAHRGELALISPVLAELGHGEIEGRDRRPVDLHQPLTTQHAGGNKFALVAPTPVQTGYGEREGQAPRCLDIPKPNGTAVGCGQKHALATSFLAKHNGGNESKAGGTPLDEPMHTITSIDHHSLVACHIQRDFSKSFGSAADDPSLTITGGGSGKSALVASTLIKLRGSVDTHPTTAQDLREPAPTFTAHGNHVAEVRAFLIKYFETGIGMPLTDPLHTITTRDRFGLVLVQGEIYQIVDITLRMLDPRELFLAQGFPPSYKIDIPYPFNRFKMLTKTAQVRMVGNSVSPPVAAALVMANVASQVNVM